MPDVDQWGYDPNVQMMRRVFTLMEKFQKELFSALDISPFDPRLRHVRTHARDLFEQTWPLAIQKEVVTNENGAALFYQHCLSHVLNLSGFIVPNHVLLEDDQITRFLRKELK